MAYFCRSSTPIFFVLILLCSLTLDAPVSAVSEIKLNRKTFSTRGAEKQKRPEDTTHSRRIKVRPGSYLATRKETSRELHDDIDTDSLMHPDNLLKAFSSAKISGGYKAPFSTSVHLAIIVILSTDGRTGACSGTILDSRRILTAAHCFRGTQSSFNVGNVGARIGSNITSGTVYLARSVDLFTAYNPLTNQNDVAIVTIKGVFEKPYKPVTLPPCSTCTVKPYASVFAAGYGRTTVNGSVSPILQETTLTVRPYTICAKNFFRITKIPVGTVYRSSQILCAMDARYPKIGLRSVCKGDSGGPLFLKRPSGMYEIGITSFGSSDCSTAGSVEFFVNVATYAWYIRQHLKGSYTFWAEIFRV